MGTIIGLVVIVLDIIAIVDCVKSSLETGKKVLWIVLIVLLPVVGMILYFLLGKQKSSVPPQTPDSSDTHGTGSNL